MKLSRKWRLVRTAFIIASIWLVIEIAQNLGGHLKVIVGAMPSSALVGCNGYPATLNSHQ